MKQIWQSLNILSVLFALGMNYIVGAQIINVPSIGSVSDEYATLLTPATYAFSIWSLIYVLLVVLAVYQARDVFRPDSKNDLPSKMGPYFILANVGNAIWTYIFVSDFIGLSVLVLVGMVVALFLLLCRLDIAMFDAPVRTIIFVWWPLMLYAGWVLVASVVNIASWLASLDITLPPFMAVATLVVLCGALLALLYTRNLRELLLASAWGIIAIGFQQMQSQDSQAVMITAFAAGSILLFASAAHGYVNREQNILAYFTRGGKRA